MVSSKLSRAHREVVRRARTIAARAFIAARPRWAKKIRSERAWMIGAAVGRGYVDNGAALHQYISTHRPDITKYWIIDAGHPDEIIARANGPTLDPNSVETYARCMLAEVHAVTHGVHDVPTCAGRNTKALRVRLGHGLTALKKTQPRTFHTNESANRIFDLVPVASDYERDNKMLWGIPGEKLEVTGLARFDTLIGRHSKARREEQKILLYMPTWRPRTPDAAFGESALAHELSGISASRALHDVLRSRGARLVIALHRNIAASAARLVVGSDVVSVAHVQDPQELLAAMEGLITDYSSVAWDALYIDKPVIFYQFDRSSFQDRQGGYLDDGDNLPGRLCLSMGELVDAVTRVLDGDVDPLLENSVSEWKMNVFAFRDDHNCARIVRAIERRLLDRKAGG